MNNKKNENENIIANDPDLIINSAIDDIINLANKIKRELSEKYIRREDAEKIIKKLKRNI
jgi:hypothetical protein